MLDSLGSARYANRKHLQLRAKTMGARTNQIK
jgi:hypothetical protein